MLNWPMALGGLGGDEEIWVRSGRALGVSARGISRVS